eukprot:scaffold60260_cov67-Phaeocystis_antarctica.AAC.3
MALCLRWCDQGVALDWVFVELLARHKQRGGLLRDVTGRAVSRDGGRSGRAARGQATRAG